MLTASGRIGITLVLALTLAACSREPNLLNLGAGSDSPDEFSILPGKPLEAPADFTALPAPTPGGTNLSDPTPLQDAVAALGGSRSAMTRTGVPASDNALITYASRNGVQPQVREELAADDLTLRQRNGAVFFRGWFGSNRYFAAYKGQALDQKQELDRLRAAGVKTPSAP